MLVGQTPVKCNNYLMCIACSAVQVPVCTATGACGGVGLLTQIVVLTSLSFTIALGTASLWWHAVLERLNKTRHLFLRKE